jgi:hypothetical protein
MAGYIYLLRTREFINANNNIFKIGRTEQCDGKRFAGYPKGSEIEFIIHINNNVEVEKTLIDIFKKEFIQKIEFGSEYFEGDRYKMIEHIYKLSMENKLIDNNTISLQPIIVINHEQNLLNKFKELYYILAPHYYKYQQLISYAKTRQICEIYNFNKLFNMADIKCNVDFETIIDFNKIFVELKKIFNKLSTIRTNEYIYYCEVHNLISNNYQCINDYESLRKLVSYPKKYIQIKLKPLLIITFDEFHESIKKCSNYNDKHSYHYSI